MLSFNQFYGSIYFVKDYIKIPLLDNMKLETINYLKRGKIDHNKIRSKVLELYEENINRFK